MPGGGPPAGRCSMSSRAPRALAATSRSWKPLSVNPGARRWYGTPRTSQSRGAAITPTLAGKFPMVATCGSRPTASWLSPTDWLRSV